MVQPAGVQNRQSLPSLDTDLKAPRQATSKAAVKAMSERKASSSDGDVPPPSSHRNQNQHQTPSMPVILRIDASAQGNIEVVIFRIIE